MVVVVVVAEGPASDRSFSLPVSPRAKLRSSHASAAAGTIHAQRQLSELEKPSACERGERGERGERAGALG